MTFLPSIFQNSIINVIQLNAYQNIELNNDSTSNFTHKFDNYNNYDIWLQQRYLYYISLNNDNNNTQHTRRLKYHNIASFLPSIHIMMPKPIYLLCTIIKTFYQSILPNKALIKQSNLTNKPQFGIISVDVLNISCIRSTYGFIQMDYY